MQEEEYKNEREQHDNGGNPIYRRPPNRNGGTERIRSVRNSRGDSELHSGQSTGAIDGGRGIYEGTSIDGLRTDESRLSGRTRESSGEGQTISNVREQSTSGSSEGSSTTRSTDVSNGTSTLDGSMERSRQEGSDVQNDDFGTLRSDSQGSSGTRRVETEEKEEIIKERKF